MHERHSSASVLYRLPRAVAALVLLLASVARAANFPPPEFSQPYPFPVQPNPAVRPELFMYLDMAVLLLALGLAAYVVLVRRSRLLVLLLTFASLLYFGFWRHGCTCAIGAIQNVAQALADPTYAVTAVAVAFFLLPLLFTLFFGRVFCAAVCPLGAVQELVLVKPLRLPRWLTGVLVVFPFITLGLGVLHAACGGIYAICRHDPFVPLFRLTERPEFVVPALAALGVSLFIGRYYCRFACPYGALLRLLQPLARRRASITPTTCSRCTLCRNACPYDAIREPVAAPDEATAARLKRQAQLLLVLAPFLLAAGGILGYAAGPALAHEDPRLVAARTMSQVEAGVPPRDPVAAEAFSRSGRTAEQVQAEAETVRQRFRVGGAAFGAWLALVAVGFLRRYTRLPVRDTFETDPMECFACGRCFATCPHEQTRIRNAQRETPAP